MYAGPHPHATTAHLLQYDEDRTNERPVAPEQLVPLAREAEHGGRPELADREAGVVWLDVVGLTDADAIRSLGAELGLHPLWTDDVVSVRQRPKVEHADGALLLVLRSLRMAEDGRHEVEAEQISIVRRGRIVVTFQERPGDPFGPVRERTRTPGSQLRRGASDRLVVALVDAIVEQSFGVLEALGDHVAELEEAAFEAPTPELLERVQALRLEVLRMRRLLWPTRDVLATLARDDPASVDPATVPYLRDAHDHAVQAVDAVELLRDVLASLQESIQSGLSLRMNEVMKVLTVISTIFIPLSFLVGVYGMNFRFMPELSWPWAYPLLWLAMTVLGASLAWGFRRRGWW